MELHYSQTSPYVRLVRHVAAHHGIDLTLTPANWSEGREALLKVNPLGKIPALVLPDDTVLYDSGVICRYLDEAGPAPALFPVGEGRWHHDRVLALCTGMLDIAVGSVMERRRPAGEQSPAWLARADETLLTSVRALTEDIPLLRLGGSMASIAAPVALDYLSFRLPHNDWRSVDKALTEVIDEALDGETFRLTDPRREV